MQAQCTVDHYLILCVFSAMQSILLFRCMWTLNQALQCMQILLFAHSHHAETECTFVQVYVDSQPSTSMHAESTFCSFYALYVRRSFVQTFLFTFITFKKNTYIISHNLCSASFQQPLLISMISFQTLFQLRGLFLFDILSIKEVGPGLKYVDMFMTRHRLRTFQYYVRHPRARARCACRIPSPRDRRNIYTSL